MIAEPVHGERALFIRNKKAIVIADLHIGIEYEYRTKGILIKSQAEKLAERCISIIKRKKADILIILGDIKHIIMEKEYARKEGMEVRKFLKEVSEHAEIWILKGNHDGRLKSKYAKIFGTRGILMDNIAMSHGHAWPAPSIMKARIFVMAHLHPQIRLKTEYGFSYTEPCWVRGKFLKKEFKEKYPEGNEDMDVIVMPAFNPVAGGIAINEDKIEHGIASIIDIKNAEAYLLNGVNLGRIRNLS